ncbi:MAG: polysaccharide deacetylase family protein [Enhygromyxa sp.]
MLERSLILITALWLPAGLGCQARSSDSVAPDASEASVAEPPADPHERDDRVAIHLSFDDAPGAHFAPGEAPTDPAAYNALNREIIATLQEHEIPASVFFNCDNLLPGDETLESWEAAGMLVGNHTASHVNLAKVGLEAWLEDLRRCDEVLRERLSAPPSYLRYPYLSQGDTLEQRDGATAALAEMGYANAHVTAATTEWLLALAYSAAKQRGEAELEDQIVAAYRQHMLESVTAARELAIHEVGRETTQVVLFHVNTLAADHLDEVLADYEAAGYRFIGLEEALADPVFELEDHYVGGGGISWLARIHDPEQPRPPYWFGLEEGRLEEVWGYLLAPPE